MLAGANALKQMRQANELPGDLQTKTQETLHRLLRDIRERNRLESGNQVVTSVNFSRDGTKIAAIRENNFIEIWTVEGQLLNSWPGHGDFINRIRFSSDGQIVAGADDNGSVELWDINGKHLKTLAAHNDWISDVLFSPDGQTMATAGHDRTVKIWNSDGLLQHTCQHSGQVAQIAYNSDGQMLAAACWDGKIVIWNPEGQQIKTIENPASIFTCIAISPDEELIATGDTNHHIKLWSSRNNRINQTFNGHQTAISNVCFAPDGLTLISGSMNQTIKLWDIESGELIETFSGQNTGVTELSVSPDGTMIASASQNQVKLWGLGGPLSADDENLELGELFERSCDWLAHYIQNNPNISSDDYRLCDFKNAAPGEVLH